MMIAVQMIQVQTILKPDPSVTGNRANPTKLPINILTKVLFVNDNTRKNFTLFASISAAGAFRLERPVLPLTNQNLTVATLIYTFWVNVTLSKILCLHCLRECCHLEFLRNKRRIERIQAPHKGCVPLPQAAHSDRRRIRRSVSSRIISAPSRDMFGRRPSRQSRTLLIHSRR